MKQIFLFFCLLLPLYSTAQFKKISIYLTPQIGGEWNFSKIEDNQEVPPYIKSTWIDFNLRYGLGLAFDFDRRFALEIGYEWGFVGYGLKHRSHTDSVLYEGGGGSVFATTNRRVGVTLSKPIASVSIIRNNKNNFLSRLLRINEKKTHWAFFDLNVLAGFTYEYIPPFIDGQLGIFVGSNVDKVILKDEYTVLNSNGWGARAGLSMQFYNQKGFRGLQLGIIYHQGLTDRISANWETSINDTPYPDFKTITKGSMLAIYASYPIRLYDSVERKRRMAQKGVRNN